MGFNTSRANAPGGTGMTKTKITNTNNPNKEKRDPKPMQTPIANTPAAPTIEAATMTATDPYVLPETTQPGDEGKKSKKKNRQSTILTSVTGVNQPATLGRKSLLG